MHLSELVRCSFDLIFDQRVETVYVVCFRNTKVLKFLQDSCIFTLCFLYRFCNDRKPHTIVGKSEISILMLTNDKDENTGFSASYSALEDQYRKYSLYQAYLEASDPK